MNLFVYGTLKQNYDANYHLRTSLFVGKAVTASKYLLCKDKNHSYPYLLNIPVEQITGELYEVDENTLNSIDKYEDHPHLFKRELIALQDGDTAWCYFYPAITQISEF